MPLVTGRISWRTSSSNKTYVALLNALRSFIVNSGNYTLVTDQITASNYFVVRSVRNTGFSGDSIVAKIGVSTYSGTTWASTPYLYIEPWESWSGTTGTNGITFSPNITGNQEFDVVPFSLSLDTDIWISCDTTFILGMSRSYSSTLSWFGPPVGVCCFERFMGDSDPGTFYGFFGRGTWFPGNYNLYPPKRWDGSVGSVNALVYAQTSIGRTRGGNLYGLFGLDEGGNHVIFEFNVSLPSQNRFKGKVYGPAVSTWGYDLAHGQLLPNPTSPQYIVGKIDSPTVSYPQASILMQVASTITTITT